MIKQVSSFLMLCLITQISFAQTSEKQNLKLKLDAKKPRVIVKGNAKDTSIAIKGETPLYIVDGKEIKNVNEISPNDIEKIDETDKKIKVSFTVNGNSAAKTGKHLFYIQVLDQKNTVLGENKLIEFGNDKALVYSFIVSTDFQGKSVNAYGILNADQFKKGTYFVNIFDKAELVGKTSFTLK